MDLLFGMLEKIYDGLDSYSQLINVNWPEIRVGIIKIDESEKD